jgi:hypothetical protein
MLPLEPIDRNEFSDHRERNEFFERATSAPYRSRPSVRRRAVPRRP